MGARFPTRLFLWLNSHIWQAENHCGHCLSSRFLCMGGNPPITGISGDLTGREHPCSFLKIASGMLDIGIIRRGWIPPGMIIAGGEPMPSIAQHASSRAAFHHAGASHAAHSSCSPYHPCPQTSTTKHLPQSLPFFLEFSSETLLLLGLTLPAGCFVIYTDSERTNTG
jgi:hypothetical protein